MRVIKTSFRGDRFEGFIENKNDIYCYVIFNLDSETNKETSIDQMPATKPSIFQRIRMMQDLYLQQGPLDSAAILKATAASFSVFVLTF